MAEGIAITSAGVSGSKIQAVIKSTNAKIAKIIDAMSDIFFCCSSLFLSFSKSSGDLFSNVFS